MRREYLTKEKSALLSYIHAVAAATHELFKV